MGGRGGGGVDQTDQENARPKTCCCPGKSRQNRPEIDTDKDVRGVSRSESSKEKKDGSQAREIDKEQDQHKQQLRMQNVEIRSSKTGETRRGNHLHLRSLRD